MSRKKDVAFSSRVNERTRDLFRSVLNEKRIRNITSATATTYFKPSLLAASSEYSKASALTLRKNWPEYPQSSNRPMASVSLEHAVVSPQTPHYPFETAGQTIRQQPHVTIRSRRNRSAIQSLRGSQYHGSRLTNYGYPSVISSTQQILCLTPSMIPASRRSSARQQYVKRFNQVESKTLPTMVQQSVTKRDSEPTATSPYPPNTARSFPLITRNNTQYRHSSNLVITARPLFKPTSAGSTAKLDSKNERLQQHRAQLESYLGPRRKDVGIVARKMAPVLRVIPAGTRVPINGRSVLHKPSPKMVTDDCEDTSQKKVRFSDQLGLPLTRNMTPNYRRKHSYILRWLETAGRPTQPLA